VPHPILVRAFQSLPQFPQLVQGLPRAGDALVVEGLAGASAALMVASLHRALPQRIWVVVATTPETADHVAADLEALLGDGTVSSYPQRESLPYEVVESHVEIGGLRV
jgi:transcription-repair coupling factor (superfamily II helicase)